MSAVDDRKPEFLLHLCVVKLLFNRIHNTGIEADVNRQQLHLNIYFSKC